MADDPFRVGLFRLWVREPQHSNSLIAVLFMIGAAHFALGCVLYLCEFSHEFTMDAVFFTGSIFFTSAACCQFIQSNMADTKTHRHWYEWRSRDVLYYAALSQFIGTLMFNMNTFDAFFNLDWIEQDLLVWSPNMFGSILFQLSGSLAMLEVIRRSGRWNFRNIEWAMNAINFAGCVAFLISAFLSFVMPSPISPLFAVWATAFTLIGACCFFVGAFLMLPKRARAKFVK